MATTLDLNYIYPANLAVPMTAAAGEPRLRRVAIRAALTTATAASTVQILTLSNFLGPDGTAPTKFAIEEVEWSMDSDVGDILLEWNADSNVVCMRLSGAGFKDYRDVGGLISDDAGGLLGLQATPAGTSGEAEISMVVRLKD